MRWKRRLRISLRAWLALTFGLAVAIGLWSRSATRQRDAVAEIWRLGGIAVYDYQAGPLSWVGRHSPRWVVNGLGEEYFFPVFLVIDQAEEHDPMPVPDEWTQTVRDANATLRAAANINSLRRIEIHGAGVSDDGLRAVTKLDHLERLLIRGRSKLTDAGIESLAEVQSLVCVEVHHAELGDRSLQALSKIDGLEELCLVEGRFTDAGLAALAGSRQLKDVCLASTESHFTDAGLMQLITLKRLERLQLFGSTFNDAAVERLKKLPRLRQFSADGIDWVRDRSLLPFATRMPDYSRSHSSQ